MNLELLRTFIAVAEGESFTAATKSRHLTQSTVSHQIKRLEESLEQQLFHRTTRSCRLTDDGDVLYQYAKKIIQLCDEVEARFKEKPLQGHINFAAPEDYLSLPFSRVLARFARIQKDVEIEITVGLSNNIRPEVDTGAIDLAILTQIPPTGEGTPLYRDPLVWLASKDFQVPTNGPIPLALVPSPCLYRKTALTALEEAGMAWQIALSCHSHEAIKAAVESGLAVTVLTQKDLRPGMRILDEKEGFPRLGESEISLHQAPNLANEAAQQLIQQILEQRDTPLF
ncbi:LysR substrate-binding domain-containing protein [Amphritea sp.]|uniref:LysR substrate-binding domain-containing protein n=1 Tax=Amphritea sp. TaxID=1872502 RepID=UPI003A931469